MIGEHPAVFPNRLGDKELHAFSHFGWGEPAEEHFDRYRRSFAAPPGGVSGEWSATYVSYPLALQHLHRAAPEAKLLLLLRNPVDRTVSAYNQYLRGRERLIAPSTPAGSAVLTRFSLFPEACEGSRYACGLAAVLARWPREQVLVLAYEELVAAPEEAYARTLRFLGVDDRFRPRDLTRPVHRQPYLAPKPTPAERARLVEWFRDDVQATFALLPEEDRSRWRELWGEFA